MQEHGGDARLDIYVAAEAFAEDEGNGAVRVEDAGHTRSAAEAAADGFLDFCARRGITTEEKDLIWNAMAFLCYERVQHRHGPFYAAIKPFLAEGEA